VPLQTNILASHGSDRLMGGDSEITTHHGFRI